MALTLLWHECELHSRSQASHVNKNSVLYVLYIFKFNTLYIPVNIIYYILFNMFLNKLTLADSTWGCIEVPGGECHSMQLGLAFLPSWKGVKQSVCFGIFAQRDHSHSVDQVHAQTFLPKLIMTSLEHCMVTSWRCKGFQMIFTSVLRGYKRRMHKRVGGSCSSSSWV